MWGGEEDVHVVRADWPGSGVRGVNDRDTSAAAATSTVSRRPINNYT